MVSKALVRSEYQRKLDAIAAHPEVEHLVALVPPSWREPGGTYLPLERPDNPAYELVVQPIRFNGSFHLFYWPRLGAVIRAARPDVVHLDEEPYNLATALGCWHAIRAHVPSLFFTWQNIQRRYPPPFGIFEQFVFRATRYALAGNADAVGVLRSKGYRGPSRVIPQFAPDPAVFFPAPRLKSDELRIGFVGRVVPEKGLDILIEACARLRGRWRLVIVGTGSATAQLHERAERLGISSRIEWLGSVPSAAIPGRLQQLDVVVQPSRTRPNWKEQFGRTLVEAMACGIPVVGSDSGEIPHVIEEAGIVVPEGNPLALAGALQHLLDDGPLRSALGARGRARALARFTNGRIADETVSVYREIAAGRPRHWQKSEMPAH